MGFSWLCGILGCTDCGYADDRIRTLSEKLAISLPVVNVPNDGLVMDPYSVVGTIYNISDYVQADAHYMAYDDRTWQLVMNDVFTIISDRFDYKTNVCDCDDFALLASAILVNSAIHNNLDCQPACAIAWSRTHAFNCLLTDDSTLLVVEPQTCQIIGEVDDISDQAYAVKKLWFMV